MKPHPLKPHVPVLRARLVASISGIAVATGSLALSIAIAPPMAWLPMLDGPHPLDARLFVEMIRELTDGRFRFTDPAGSLLGLTQLPFHLVDLLGELDLLTSIGLRGAGATLAGLTVGSNVHTVLRSQDFAAPVVEHIIGPQLLAGKSGAMAEPG